MQPRDDLYEFHDATSQFGRDRPQSEQEQDASPFFNLPHELHLAIIDSIDDVAAVIALSRTNRYFHEFCNYKKVCSDSVITAFLEKAERFPKWKENGGDGGLACSSCQKVLRRSRFTVRQRWRYLRGERDRLCTPCELAHGECRVGEGFSEGGSWGDRFKMHIGGGLSLIHI